MSTTNVIWTAELKAELAKHWQRGKYISEIAAIMGIPFEKIQSAIKRARKVSGEKRQNRYSKQYTRRRTSCRQTTPRRKSVACPTVSCRQKGSGAKTELHGRLR